jgi:hypothetical protein
VAESDPRNNDQQTARFAGWISGRSELDGARWKRNPARAGFAYGEDRADVACEAVTWGPPIGRGRGESAHGQAHGPAEEEPGQLGPIQVSRMAQRGSRRFLLGKKPLTSRAHRAVTERARAREGEADVGAPRVSEREGKRRRARERLHGGPTCRRRREGFGLCSEVPQMGRNGSGRPMKA